MGDLTINWRVVIAFVVLVVLMGTSIGYATSLILTSIFYLQILSCYGVVRLVQFLIAKRRNPKIDLTVSLTKRYLYYLSPVGLVIGFYLFYLFLL